MSGARDHGMAAGDPIVAQLRAWAVEQALPLWTRVGFDHERGGFHERLAWDGRPDLAAPRRTRVQARQIYVYAHAAALGWFPEGLAYAARGLEFMIEKCRAPDGAPGYVHLLAPGGAVANPLRDTYDHAFILLALAWYGRASGDAQARVLIDETLAFMDEHLAAGDGTLLEGVPSSEPRRQNPHMHCLESMLALHETVGHPAALGRATRLRDLLVEKFLDAPGATLREYFTHDWRPWPAADADFFEPGHHAEWAWLLRRHERFAGARPGPLASALLDAAVREADPRTGLLIDGVERAGARRHTTRRCWPQTELAKAWLAEAEVGRPGAAEAARRTLAALAEHYLAGPVAGGWIDQFDAQGVPTVTLIPASTFYHLFCAIAEAERVLGVSAGAAS